MLTIHTISGHTITLGREGENLARQVVFDVSEWRASYGDGTVSLIAQRSGDDEPYPCNITVDGSTVKWEVVAADTAHPGYGKCELRYSVGDVLVKSETWLTYTADALGTPAPEPPELQKAWVDKVLEAGQAAVDASVNPPKIGENGNWFVWDFDSRAYVDTGVKASGGDIVRIELADYGLYLGSNNASVSQEFVDILRDALVNRKAPYVHGAIKGFPEGTVLLDTMYTTGSMIFATGIGVLINNGAFPAWFAIVVDQDRLTVSVMYGPAGEDGYSPTVDVSREGDKTVLTITDVNGVKTVEIPDGKDGAVSSVNGKTGAVDLTAADIGAMPPPMHINFGSYDTNFLDKLMGGIMSGKTEFSITLDNSAALWEAINNSAGDIWVDVPLSGDGAYSVKVSGMSRDANGEIFWIDLKISAYNGHWMILYLSCGGDIIQVKVEAFGNSNLN